MPLNFVKSQRNNDVLELNGYLYYKMSEHGSRVLWRCVYYKKQNCKSSCITFTKYSSGDILKEPQHNHPPNHEEITSKRILRKVVKCRRLIRKDANRLTMSKDMTIPDACKVTNRNQPFLLYSDDQKPGVMLFSTRSNLNVLIESSTWICTWIDRCSVPAGFHRLYIIHCRVRDDVLPLVYVLTAERRKYTYERMLKQLVALEPALGPKLIHTNFDRTFTSQLERMFPNAEMKGCFARFCKCIWEKLKTTGLKMKYNKDITFAEQVRCLCALSFVPAKDVRMAYQKLVTSKYYVDNLELLQRMLSYFEYTWVGYLAYGHRKNPVFPIKMWNSYDMIVNEEPNAITPVQRWHQKFKLTLENNCEEIADFINLMKSEQDSLEASLEQPIVEDTSSPFTKNSDIYLNRDISLKVIVDNYDLGDTLLYLKFASQIFDLQKMNCKL